MTAQEPSAEETRKAIEASQTPRKRRTPEQLRAHFEAQIKKVDEGEKREVIRLLSGIADDLKKVTTYKCYSACKAQVDATIAHVNAALQVANK